MPGTRGAKGRRYFSVAVTLTAPKVRPWKEFSSAKMRCLRAGEPGDVGGRASVEAGELESAFDGFRTAIGEENAVHAGPLRELASQRALKRVVKKIGKMNSARSFATDDFDDAGDERGLER